MPTKKELQAKINKLRNEKAPKKKGSKGRNKRSENFRRARQQPAPRSGPTLSVCSKRYLLACTDPRNPKAIGACVPCFPAQDSYKKLAFSRFSASTGVDGFGFVAIIPCLASDRACAVWSTSSYVGTSMNLTDGAGNWSPGTAFGVLSMNPYPTVNLTPGGTAGNYTQPDVQGRIVSCSLHVHYDGERDTCGGTFYGLVSPSRTNMSGYSLATLGSNIGTVMRSITPGGKGIEIVTCGSTPREVGYADYDPATTTANALIETCYPFSSETKLSSDVTDVGAIPMAVMWNSTTGNTFQCEYYQHSEFLGALVQQTTQNTPDPVGFQIVNTALSRLDRDQPSVGGPSLTTLATKVVNNVISEMTGPVGASMGRHVDNKLINWVMEL